MWTKVFALLGLIAATFAAVVENPDLTRAVYEEGVANLAPTRARPFGAMRELAKYMTPEAVGQFDAEAEKRFDFKGFLEINMYDLFKSQSDYGQWDCQNDYHGMRYTFTLGKCLPDVFFDYVTVKIAADNNGVLRISGFNDKDCSSPPMKFNIDLRMMTPCSYGSKFNLVNKRTPHTMGMSERWYRTKDCSGDHNDVFWSDYTCWTDTRDSSSYMASCGAGYIDHFVDSYNCQWSDYTQFGYLNETASFNRCVKEGAHFVSSKCGGAGYQP